MSRPEYARAPCRFSAASAVSRLRARALPWTLRKKNAWIDYVVYYCTISYPVVSLLVRSSACTGTSLISIVPHRKAPYSSSKSLNSGSVLQNTKDLGGTTGLGRGVSSLSGQESHKDSSPQPGSSFISHRFDQFTAALTASRNGSGTEFLGVFLCT